MAASLRSKRVSSRRWTIFERLEHRRLLAAVFPPGTPNTLTFHGDSIRSGFNQNETVLTPTNVAANFGQVWQSPVLDGHLYASPLYMDNVVIGAQGSGNGANHAGDGVVAGAGKTLGVVFAATGGGSVYAIKAFDTNGPTGVAAGTILWKTFLGTPSASTDGNSIGVLGTPIIDAESNRLYVVASVHDYLLSAADPNHGAVVFEAFALDLGSGTVLPGWPVVLNQTVLDAVNQNQAIPANAGGVAFGAATSGNADERGALNLSPDGSVLYVPFASYGSSNGGWLVNVATGITNGVANGQTPAVVSAFSATDQLGTAVGNGGIWGAGGPAVDASGNVFVATGDSPSGTKQMPGSWGNSVLEFNPNSASNQTLTLSGAYTPWNYQTQDTIDTDLGGAAPIIIQMPAGSSNTTELLATGGKQGNAYLVDAGNGLNNPGATPADLTMRPPVVPPNQDPSLYDPNAIRSYFSPPQAGPLNVFGPYSELYGATNYGRSRTTPAMFIGPDGSYYIVWTGSQKITDSSTIPTAPGVVVTKIVATPGQNAYLQIATQNTQTLSLPGSSLVTADGTLDPIVWVVDAGVQRTDSLATGNFNNGAPTLYAYDALTMQPLWSSPYKQLDTGGKYNTIAVAHDVALVGTDRIQAFGLTTNTSVDDSVIGSGIDQFQYVGAWSHTTPGTSTATMGTFQGTVSTDSFAGDYATLTFSGSQIKVYADEMSNYGTAAISIDGGPATTVSLSNSTNSPNGQGEGDVLVYTSPTLDPGSHTLTFLNTSNATIALDRVEISPISASSALGVSLTEGNVTAAANQLLQYMINYQNAGSISGSNGINAAGVVLMETVPANTSFNSAASTAGWVKTSGNGAAGSTYTLNVGNLAAGDAGSVVFAITVNGSISAGTLTLSNTVSIADAASDMASGSRATPLIGTPVAYKLAFAQVPTDARVGMSINPAVSVVVLDQFGNLVASDQSTVTLTLNDGTFSGGSSSVMAQAAGGVATFSNLVINSVGNYTVSASDDGLISTTSSTFSVASASQLAFTEQPTDTTAGVNVSSVSVTIEDFLGNPVTGDTSTVSLLLNGGTFANGAAAAAAQAVNGVATFNNLVVNSAGTYTLTATDGSLITATSTGFTVAAAAPASLAFTDQPSSGAVGTPLNPVTLVVKDQFGNIVASDTSTVTLTLSSGVFSTGSNTVSVQASDGIAIFNGLTIDANGSYELWASDAAVTGATSSSFTISPILSIDDSFSDPPTYQQSTKGTGVDQVNYSGSGWGTVTGTALVGAYNGTVTNSSGTSNTATVLFNGVQIAFYAGEKNNRGIAAVSIDGGPETMIDLYANDSTGFCTLVYTSPVLPAGSHSFTVRVTNTKDAKSSGTTVSIDRFDVIKGASMISWSNPSAIVYGTPLDVATQLNATASVPGTFTYSPPAGTVLSAGQGQTLSVSFVPTDSVDYLPATASVTIDVAKADPMIDWPEPAGLLHGEPLTPTELDATANVPGSFAYSPDVGATLPTQPDNPLSAIFTPQDTADYNTVTVGSVIDYFPATPTIAWPAPADMTYGAPLGSAQLDASATFQDSPLDGTFSYSPAAGTVLGLGQNQTLNATFTPTDTTDFVTATASVAINVDPLTVSNANDSGPGSLRQAMLDAANLPGTTHTIYFELPSGSQVINLQTPLPNVSDPIVAVVDDTQNVVVNSPISGGADRFGPITKSGAGSLTLAGTNQLNGNLVLHEGQFRLAASAVSTVSGGASVTIDDTGMLELGGSFSDLSGGGLPADISNISTAPTGIEVSGSHQIVGNISGTGNSSIAAGADLTANSIIQSSLVIGGTAGSPAFVTIAPSDFSGNPMSAIESTAQAKATAQASISAANSPSITGGANPRPTSTNAGSVGSDASSSRGVSSMLIAAEWLSTLGPSISRESDSMLVDSPTLSLSPYDSSGSSAIGAVEMARPVDLSLPSIIAANPDDSARSIDEALESLLADDGLDRAWELPLLDSMAHLSTNRH